ncbi:SAP-like protein BP-73 [Phalaenopsis equestris]|uniref:SAP-like protein BP-73 n=1 Tax=Phalaenopsis equestris TaxID=78828 RepID=UPI0009E5D247|nr:SAP-like protein BP-73 [Phalaenopsis equestris]
MVSDCNFLYYQGAIGRSAMSFSPNNRRQKLFLEANLSLRTSVSRYPSIVSMCKGSSNKRNPDFSRKYRGSSKGKRQSQEKENSENPEDNLLSSKNGSLVSHSNNQRFSATATPGRREKEIVELFRKVQLQLRERAAIKEEKRVESAQVGQGDRGTVDSLLKLLRKHSTAQSKKSSSSDDGYGYDLDQPERANPFDEAERSDLFEEEHNSNFFESDHLGTQDVVHDLKPPFPSSRRPISRFKRKSPVPKVKFQPVLSDEEEGRRSLRPTLNSQEMAGMASEPEIAVLDLQPQHPVELAHDHSANLESLDAESKMGFDQSDPSDSDLDETSPEMSEPPMIQESDLGSMKLSELRGLAKSKGFKGYSKLKKIELLELLTENTD